MNRFSQSRPHLFPKLSGKYSWGFFCKDLTSALSVALLGIPQAIAYSFLAGLPVFAGVFSTIFATMMASFFCGSRLLISGPSTSMAILIQGVVLQIIGAQEGISVEEKMLLTFLVLGQMGVLIAFLQLLLSFCNVSKVLQFVSKPVIFGYFLGVAIAIIVHQTFSLFGMYIPEKDFTILQKVVYFFSHLQEVRFAPLFIGALSLAILLSLKRTRLPAALFMLIIAGFFKELLFSFTHTELIVLKQDFLLSWPAFSFPKIKLFWLDKLIFPASAIAFMSILEVAAVSKAVHGKSGDFVNTNQEVFGVGLANGMLSFFPGVIPASASISRSIVNYMNGAKSRVSGILSGVFVAGIFYFGFSWLSYIPMASIAALLIFSSFYFLDKEQVKLCLRATREDAFAFIITVFCCFIFSLDTAFFIGIGVSIISYLRKASEPTYREYAFNRSGHLNVLQIDENLHRRIRILGVGGELFFAVVDSLEETLRKIGKDPHTKVIILRMNGIRNVDASTCLAFLRIHEYLQSQKKIFMVSGITPSVWKVFSSSSLIQKIGKDNFFLADEGRPQLSTWKACLKAQEIVE